MADPDMDADGYDAQDQAEAFDETHNTDESGYPDETRSFEPDLFEDTYDVTAKQGDSDEDDIALDADEYDPDELSADEAEEDEDDVHYLDDDLEDEDDDLEEDDRLTEESVLNASADEVDMQLVDNLDDQGGNFDRLARRYESTGELSQAQVRSLGYGQDDKESTMSDDKTIKDKDAKGSGASAEDVVDESHPRQEELLDEGVEETFPASDPVSVKHIT